MTDKELIDGFGNACLRAGLSNSGLAINAGASGDWDAMQQWRAAVTSRLSALQAERDALRKTLSELLPFATRDVERLNAQMVGDLYPRINLAMLERARALAEGGGRG